MTTQTVRDFYPPRLRFAQVREICRRYGHTKYQLRQMMDSGAIMPMHLVGTRAHYDRDAVLRYLEGANQPH